MRTFSKLKGLPVYSNSNADLLGHIADLCLSSNGSVIGLMMEGKGLFNRDRFVPIESIQALGENGVMVEDKNKLISIQNMRANYSYNTYGDIRYKSVFTREGQKLGLLEDVYFSKKRAQLRHTN